MPPRGTHIGKYMMPQRGRNRADRTMSDTTSNADLNWIANQIRRLSKADALGTVLALPEVDARSANGILQCCEEASEAPGAEA